MGGETDALRPLNKGVDSEGGLGSCFRPSFVEVGVTIVRSNSLVFKQSSS